MKLPLNFFILIITLSFEKSICLESYNGKCPHRSKMKTRASWVCGSNPLENYSCLYGINGSVESCRDKADYAAPGQRYVVKENPHPENCPIYKYQPYKLWSNRSSDCEFIKSECSELGQIACGIGTTISDLTCRCDHMRGYAFLTTPRNVSFCEPTLEDCSCFLKTCDENTILAPDYTCKPIKYVTEHITCLSLPDHDNTQVNSSRIHLKVLVEERRNMFDTNYLINKYNGIFTAFIITIIVVFLIVIYFCHELFYTPQETVYSFTNKILRNFKKLKTSINEQTGEQLVKNCLLTQTQLEHSEYKNYILLNIARNSKTILQKSRLKGIPLIDEILKMDLIDSPYIPKPSAVGVSEQKRQLEDQEEDLLEFLDSKCLVDDFVENLIFDLSDLEDIIQIKTHKDCNKCFIEKVRNTLTEGSYWLLQKTLEDKNRKNTFELLNLSVFPLHISCLWCKINKDMEDILGHIRLDIKFIQPEVNEYLNETLISRYNLCNIILLSEMALCFAGTSENNVPVYKPLRCLSADLLRKFVLSNALTNIVEKVIYNDNLQQTISPGKYLVDVFLKRVSTNENSTEIEESTDDINDASSDVALVNKDFIMEEIDTESALECLRRQHFYDNPKVGDPDKEQITALFENNLENSLETLLDVLRDHKREYLLIRLNTSKKVFSVDVDREVLSANILHHLKHIVRDLKEKALYRVVIDALSERDIPIYIDDKGAQQHTIKQDDSDRKILQLVTTVIKKGRNSMLNFVDILYKFNLEKLATDILYFIPNTMPEEEKDQTVIKESLNSDVLLHGQYELVVS